MAADQSRMAADHATTFTLANPWFTRPVYASSTWYTSRDPFSAAGAHPRLAALAAHDFVGRQLDLAAHLVVAAAHEPLDGVDGVLRVGHRPMTPVATKPLATAAVITATPPNP